MTKAEREKALAARKQQIQGAIAAMKASKIKNLGRVQPTPDELDQIAAPTPSGEPKLLGFSRTIDDVEDTTLFDTESETVTKCIMSEVDGGIRLLLSAVSSTTLQVFNPDLPDGAHIFTSTVNANEDSWTNTVRTEAGNRVCLQAADHAGTSQLPTIKEAAYAILGGGADRHDQADHSRALTHEAKREESRRLTCSYNEPCIEHAGTPTSHDCGGTHSSAVDDARMGVAGILFQTSSGAYGCSGSLINGPDINGDLFLTAYHCISTTSEASSIEFYFFEYEDCGACNGGFSNNINGQIPSQQGAVIMNTYPDTDATLLRLKGIAPTGAVSLGYSTTPIASADGTNLYRISHPRLGHQAYSDQKVDTARGHCQTLPVGNYTYSSAIFGNIEGGSSGSPVVNSLGQIVGQLYGLCGASPRVVCNKYRGRVPFYSKYDDAIVDGALAASYTAFEPWLSMPATCKGAGETCDSNTTCCSGKGNCLSDGTCAAWDHQTPTPTCTDGKQNGDETGIDCGGSTCQSCPTCNDNIQNGAETGQDCGGPDCPACPTPAPPPCTAGSRREGKRCFSDSDCRSCNCVSGRCQAA